MLSDAIEEIHREFEAAADRRNQELKRRADVRRVDDYLLSIEDIIENRRGAVPAPLMDDITRFVRPLSRKLLRALNRNVTRDPVRGLDVLFDCQQLLLPRLMVAYSWPEGVLQQENRQPARSISRIAVAVESGVCVK